MAADTTSDEGPEVTLALIGEWAVLAAEADRVRAGRLVVVRFPSAVRALRRELRQQRPDWLLLGAGIPDESLRKLAAVARAVTPNVGLAVLGAADDVEREEHWRHLGAWVYLADSSSAAHLSAAIRASNAEDLSVSDACFQRLEQKRQAETQAHLLNHLTAREQQILILVAAGLSNQAIAAQLSISRNTVEAHLRSLFLKLNATNRTEAVAHARRAGLL